jgi:hypothetical protein
MSVSELDERSDDATSGGADRSSDVHDDSEPGPSRRAGRLTGSRLRWWYRVVLVVAVSPITVSALRRGLSGWEPTWDVATTTVRIRDVFSAHPPLTGMAALPSSGAEVAYSFPGAFHLYLLAVPVRLLGTTWGLLVGMAVINSALSVVGIWLLRRRLGERWAMVGALFLGVLAWTVGSGMLIYPTPLAIGVVPMFAFLVAAWSVADGDAPALLALAFIGNYLFVNQLVFAVVVPVVGLVALGLYVARLWRTRRDGRHRWTVLRRRHLRWLAAGVALTVVVWIPPLVDQFFLPGGNLGKLVHAITTGQVAERQQVQHAPSLTGALGVVASVTAVPRAWLFPSFRSVPFDVEGGGVSFLAGTGWTLVLLGLLGWVAWRAHRRGDSRVTTAVAIAVAGWVAYVITALNNPDSLGYLQRYFLGLWPLGAFMWFVALVGVVTARPRLVACLRRRSVPILSVLTVGLVIVVSLAGFRPTEAHALGPSRTSPMATAVRAAMTTEAIGSGPVLVVADSYTRSYFPSALLGLQDAGIEFRVAGPFDAEQFGDWRSQQRHPDAVTRLRLSKADDPNAHERLIARVMPPPVLGRARFAEIDAAMHRWIATPRPLRVNPAVQVDATLEKRLETGLADLRRRSDERGTDPLDEPALLKTFSAWGDTGSGPLFVVPGLHGDDLQRWAQEAGRRAAFGTVFLFVEPLA